MEPTFTIGEMTVRCGVEAHVLRHWEDARLLAPSRTAGGQRRYTEGDLVRVAVILLGKEAGMSLEEVRSGLLSGDRACREERLHRFLAELEVRIERMRAARSLIHAALSCEAQDFLGCPDTLAFVRAHVSRVDLRLA